MAVIFADGRSLERVLEQLLAQKATLDDIVQRQEQLSGLVRAQHRELQRKIRSAPGSVWGADDEEDRSSLGPADEASQLGEPGAAAGLRSSEEERVEQTEYPAPVQTTGKLPLPLLQTGSEEVRSEMDSTSERNAALRPSRRGNSCLAQAKRVVGHPLFELAMGAVIMLNFCTVFAELHWKGYGLAHDLGLRPDDNGWEEAKSGFSVIEKLFNACFLLELLSRIGVFGREFFLDLMNVGDAVVVLLSCIDSFVLDFVSSDPAASKLGVFARLIRVSRALRLLRFLRVIRFMGMFTSLRVLVKTITKSVDALVWSMALLGFIVLAVSMLVVQLTTDFLQDDAVEREKRVWMYEHFGSSGRASYSMFEATFTAKWATHFSEPLIEDVSAWFGIFWILYTVAVNFAVVRVVSALFLKQTMEVAAMDHSVRVQAKMRENEKLLERLEAIFELGDQDGNGVLHKWEFEEMLVNKTVLELFAELEIDRDDLLMLFNLLSEDDGVVDQDEFLSGVMKLKSNMRTVDMIQVQHDQSVLKAGLDVVKDGLERIDMALHPSRPWRASQDPSKRITERRKHKAKLGPKQLGRAFTRSLTTDADVTTYAVAGA